MTEERRKRVIDTCRAAVKEEFRKLRSIDDISALGGLRRAVASRLPDLTDAEYCEAEYVVITELKGDADCYSTLASVAERHARALYTEGVASIFDLSPNRHPIPRRLLGCADKACRSSNT